MPYHVGDTVRYTDMMNTEYIATIEEIDGPKHVVKFVDDVDMTVTRTVYGIDHFKSLDGVEGEHSKSDTEQEQDREVVHEGQKRGRRSSVAVVKKRASLSERQKMKKKKGQYIGDKGPTRSLGRAQAADKDAELRRANLVTRAAITIEKYTRRFLVLHRIQVRARAATCIQKNWVGYSVRKAQTILAASVGNLNFLRHVVKRVDITRVRNAKGETILHACCRNSVRSEGTLRKRFKCAVWIIHHLKELMGVKDAAGIRGQQCWEHLCASKIQAGARGMKYRLAVVMKCARDGTISALRAIFQQQRINPFVTDRRGRTILHLLASVCDRKQARKGVKWVLNKFKPLICKLDKDKRLPIHHASLNLSCGSPTVDPVITMLLKSGNDCFAVDKFKRTPLDYIVSSGDLCTFQYVLEQYSSKVLDASKLEAGIGKLKKQSLWWPSNQLQRSRTHQFETGSEGFSPQIRRGYIEKREEQVRYGLCARRTLTVGQLSQPLKHLEQYQDIVLPGGEDVFRNIVCFDRENAYTYGASCKYAPHSRHSNFPEEFSLYFEMSFSEEFLKRKGRKKAPLRAGISFDSDWKALSNTELLGELGYEEDVNTRGSMWSKAYRHQGQHPADFAGTGFVLPETITTGDIVGFGWNSVACELFLTLNGRVLERQPLIIPRGASFRPGISCMVGAGEYCGVADHSFVSFNFGQFPFVYAAAWFEKKERSRMILEDPSHSYQLHCLHNDMAGSFSNNSGVLDWIFAVEKAGKVLENSAVVTGVTILLAAQADDVEQVRRLINTEKVLLTAKDDRFMSHVAILQTADMGAFMQQQSGSSSCKVVVTPSQRNIFHFAVLAKSTNVLKFLLGYSESCAHIPLLTCGDSENCTPMHLAARVDNLEALKLIRGHLCDRERGIFMQSRIGTAPSSRSKPERSSQRSKLAALSRWKKVRDCPRAKLTPLFAEALEQRSMGGLNVLHHAVCALSVRSVIWILKQHCGLLNKKSKSFKHAGEWVATGGSSLHLVANAMVGIFPFGTPNANALNYSRVPRSIEARRDVAVSLLWRLASMSEKASETSDRNNRTAEELLQCMLKQLNQPPSAGTFSSHVLPSLSDGPSKIKQACRHARGVLKDIYGAIIEKKWKKVFFVAPSDNCSGDVLLDQEETEMRKIEERRKEERRQRKLKLKENYARELQLMTEKSRLAKEQELLQQNILEQKRANKTLASKKLVKPRLPLVPRADGAIVVKKDDGNLKTSGNIKGTKKTAGAKKKKKKMAKKVKENTVENVAEFSASSKVAEEDPVALARKAVEYFTTKRGRSDMKEMRAFSKPPKAVVRVMNAIHCLRFGTAFNVTNITAKSDPSWVHMIIKTVQNQTFIPTGRDCDPQQSDTIILLNPDTGASFACAEMARGVLAGDEKTLRRGCTNASLMAMNLFDWLQGALHVAADKDIPTEIDETQEDNEGGEEMPLFASGGGDESMGPPNESEEDVVLTVPNVSITPRAGKNFTVHRVNSSEFKGATDALSNTTESTALKTSAKTSGVTPENEQSVVPTRDIPLSELPLEELEKRMNRLLDHEDIVHQSMSLVNTMTGLGTSNFGLTIDALDHAYNSLKECGCLPIITNDEDASLRHGNSTVPFLSTSWREEYDNIILDNTYSAPDKVMIKSRYLEQSMKFEAETKRLAARLNRYSSTTNNVLPSAMNEKILSPVKKSITMSGDKIQINDGTDNQKLVRDTVTKSRGMQEWARSIKKMRDSDDFSTGGSE